MKRLFTIIMIFYTATICQAQTSKIRQIKIGDTIPDLVLNGFLNSENPMKLSDLHQGKGLIISFWATWCGACLKELPILDSLAKANPKRLNVLAVTYEKENIVKNFFERRKDLPLSNLHIVNSDTLLTKYFKHKVLPHNIWIDSMGVVKSITGTEGINEKNVLALYQGQPISAPIKNDEVDFDMFKTFHRMDSNFIYRSILTGYADGIPGGTVYHPAPHPIEKRLVRALSFNISKSKLLWDAVNKKKYFKDYFGIMEIHTKDSTRFFWPSECPESFSKSSYESRKHWMESNLYCYELSLPFDVVDTLFYEYTLNDLKRAFKVSIHTEKKEITCSVIRKSKKSKRELESSVTDTAFIKINNKELQARNITVSELFDYLNERVKPDLNSIPIDPPYVDKTGIKHRIDVDLSFEKGRPNYDQIKSMLREKYGLEIIQRKHPYTITIVKDLGDCKINCVK